MRPREVQSAFWHTQLRNELRALDGRGAPQHRPCCEGSHPCVFPPCASKQLGTHQLLLHKVLMMDVKGWSAQLLWSRPMLLCTNRLRFEKT
jgi:hypothetical protein